MSRQIRHHGERAPAARVRSEVAEVVFFPGEVARLLELDQAEYGQLRRLFVLARVTRGEPRPGRAWSRYSLVDLAGVEVLLQLGGGRSALQAGRHLVLGDVEAACAALRDLGVENPLLEVPLARQGRRILARVDEYVFEPATGQLMIDEIDRRVAEFLDARIIRDRRVRSAIKGERASLRRKTQLHISVDAEFGTIRSATAT